MGRVGREREDVHVHRSQAHQRAQRATYKVIYEGVAEKRKLKTFLSFDAVPPKGYTFIPAGDPQLTKRCKKISKQLGLAVSIVSTGAHASLGLSKEVHRIGYHFATIVVDRACESLGVTLNVSGRVIQSHFAYLNEDELKDAVALRQARGRRPPNKMQPRGLTLDTSLSQAVIDSQAREAIKDLFPKIPAQDIHEIIIRAFDKKKGLVGTAQGTSLVRRANLAVVAHIRHTYTNYDELLRSGMTWMQARRGVEQFMLDKLISWRADDDDDDDDPIIEEVLREIVVISDNEGDERRIAPPLINGRRIISQTSTLQPSRVSVRPTYPHSSSLMKPPDTRQWREYVSSEEDDDENLSYRPSKSSSAMGQSSAWVNQEDHRLDKHRHSRYEAARSRRKQGILPQQAAYVPNYISFPKPDQPIPSVEGAPDAFLPASSVCTFQEQPRHDYQVYDNERTVPIPLDKGTDRGRDPYGDTRVIRPPHTNTHYIPLNKHDPSTILAHPHHYSPAATNLTRNPSLIYDRNYSTNQPLPPSRVLGPSTEKVYIPLTTPTSDAHLKKSYQPLQYTQQHDQNQVVYIPLQASDDIHRNPQEYLAPTQAHPLRQFRPIYE